MATYCHLMPIFLIYSVLTCSWSMHVSIPKEEYEVKKGGEVTLPCSFSLAVSDYDILVLTWTVLPDTEGDPVRNVATFYLDGTIDIKPEYESRTSLEVNVAQGTSSLRIRELTMEDSRHYQCNLQVPKDDEGKTFAITSILVLAPPSPPVCTIKGQPEYGHNINLTCKSEEGSPQPTTKWKTFSVENTARAYPPKAFVSPDGVFHLFNVSRETSGFFICESTNRLGSASCNLTLSVMPGSMNIGSTALIVVGVLVGVILAFVVIFCLCRRRRMKKQNKVERAQEDAYFDKNGPETGEQYEDNELSKITKQSHLVEHKNSPKSTERSVGSKLKDDQHSDGDSDDASQRYQNQQHEGYRGSRDRLDDKPSYSGESRDRLDDQRNRYGGSRDRLDDSRDHYRGSRDRLDESRDHYRGSRDRLDESRDHYRGSRDRLDESRDQYRGNRDPAYDNRDQSRPSRDRHDDYHDQYRASRDRLDDRSDHYGGSSRSDHYGGGGHGSGGYNYDDD